MLEVETISASYGATEVLHGLSFTALPGQITSLIGTNGAGKTTTLNSIIGVVRPTAGRILWQGREITRLRTPEIIRLGLSLIPEGRHVFPQMTVAENLEMGAYTRKDKPGIRRDFEWVFQLFPKLQTRLGQLAGTLSGGEQQMLAVGRALMADPDLILMDEPSMGLAPVVVEEVFKVIGEISARGKTILLVEQNAALALGIAHQAYVIELGRVVLAGSGNSLLHNPEVEKAYLGL
ncbi:MAG: ABC transporter ATP-binding protein [Negativicutes bacterium]|nr:ABC transporter ATP-binding protein [Negativicutes bacterium]